MSKVHYAFIARDSDMIVFEKHINRNLNLALIVRLVNGLDQKFKHFVVVFVDAE